MRARTFFPSDHRAMIGRFRLAILLLLLVALALTGGIARETAPQQAIARLAAILALAATAWPLERLPADRARWWWITAVYGLVLLQLVPLPADLWAALPGHDPYADIARTVGAERWRPISLAPDLTVNALLALLPATAAAIAMAYLPPDRHTIVIRTIVLLAAASALLGLAQLVVGDPASLQLYRYSSIDSATGLFANRNHNAYFLALALPLVPVAIPWRGDRRALLAAGATIALLGAGIVVTASRMGLLAGAIGGATAVWLMLRRRARIAPRTVLGGLGLATIAALAAWLSGVLDRLAATDLSDEMRWRALPSIVETAAAFMPVGAGFGAFDTAYRRFEPFDLLSTTFLNEAHNEVVQLAVEGGVPALLLLAAFLWWWIARARTAWISGETARRASVAATAIVMLAGLVDYPLRTPLLGAVFAVLCTIMARRGAAESGAR